MGSRGPVSRSKLTAPQPVLTERVPCPAWLPENAAVIWNETEPRLRARGVMRAEYEMILGQYCAVSAELKILTATIAREGSTTEGKQGLTPSPAHAAASRLRGLLATYTRALLLDPASVARAEAPADGTSGDGESLRSFIASRNTPRDSDGPAGRELPTGSVADYIAKHSRTA